MFNLKSSDNKSVYKNTSSRNKLGNTLKKSFAVVMGSAVLLLSNNPLSLIKQANASADWEYKNGIFGEIKYVKACNQGWGTYIKVIIEAGSGDRKEQARVTDVSLKMLSSQKFANGKVGYTNNSSWREVRTWQNTYPKDRRWYETEMKYPLTWMNPERPVKFSIHVFRQDWGTKYPVIDLGKIKDLGKIPMNSCTVWDDGKVSEF
jgi:hypothetical protein